VNLISDTTTKKNATDLSSNLPNDSHKAERLNALNYFNQYGYPNVHHEEWKYLNLDNIKNTPFNHNATTIAPDKTDLVKFKIAGNEAIVLVFLNGVYHPELSDLNNNAVPFTLTAIESLDTKPYFGKLVSLENEPFNALNTAYQHGGLMLRIEDSQHIQQAIHLLYLTDSATKPVAAHPRTLIVAGKHSKVQIIASYHTFNHQLSLTNSLTEFFVEEGAYVEYDIKQNEGNQAMQVNRVYANVKRNAVFDICTVTVGGKLVRNNLDIKLSESNASAHLYGLTLASDGQVIDNHTVVDHASPNCESNQLYKNILDGNAQGVFNGKIFVRKDAQKTNAFQSSKNVLLSNEAVMNAKPQLEIFADDVKCSHGATTGQLDDDALFYFRSRGIGERDARALLNYAFAGDVIDKINNAHLKANLLKILAQKLNTAVEFES
jgi:Fe-S cluster assembly protein SufD